MNRTVKKPVRKHGFLAAVVLSVLCVLSPASVFADCPDSIGKVIRVPLDQATIQAAIDYIPAGGTGYTILVAPGTYSAAGFYNIDVSGTNDTQSRGVTILSEGGRDVTIIDCQSIAGRRGFEFDSNVLAGTRLDGFTIINGRITDATGGAGILINSSAPTIVNCIIRNCSATAGTLATPDGGGGMRVNGGCPVIDNCIFKENLAYCGGGGLLASGSSCGSPSSMKITNCEFISNIAGEANAIAGNVRGGGIYLYNANPLIANTTIDSNIAKVVAGVNNAEVNPISQGGGIAIVSTTTYTELNSCAITNNTAQYGGGVYINASNTNVKKSGIGQNTAELDGGNVYIYSGAPTFENTDISEGVADRRLPGLTKTWNTCAAAGIIEIYPAGSAGYYRPEGKGGGVYIYSGTPTFNACKFNRNYTMRGGAIYQEGTPTTATSTFNNCFITNNKLYCNSGGGDAGNGCEGNYTSWGGGAFINAGTATFRHCTITNNYAHNYGVLCQPCSTCTHSENEAGGGIKNISGTVNVYNSILYGNMGFYTQSDSALNIGLGGGTVTAEERPNQTSGTVTLTGCCIQGSCEPAFEDINNSYALLSGSPCINATTTNGLATDIEGDYRPSNGTGYDQGCDEFDSDCGRPIFTQALAAGTPGIRWLDNIGGPNDKDFYAFTLAVASDVVIYTTGSTDTKINLYASTCAAVPVLDDNSGMGQNAYLNQSLNAATYYVEVFGAEGPYTLVIGLVDDFGDACGDASDLNLGASKDAKLNRAGDMDFYRIFSGNQSGQLKLYTVSALDTYGIALDQDCEQTDASDTCQGDALCSGSNFLIPDTFIDKQETRYVAVTTPSGTATGSYQLAQAFKPDDHGNDYTEARPINGFAAPQAGNIDYNGDKDCFRFFVGEPGMSINIKIEDPANPGSPPPVIDPATTLYNSSGVQIGAIDRGDAFTEYLYPGLYYLTVRDVGTATGVYQVKFTEVYDDHGGNCAEGTVLPEFNPVQAYPGVWSAQYTIDNTCGTVYGDEDFFKITLPGYGNLCGDIDIPFDSTLVSRISLWDSECNPIVKDYDLSSEACLTLGPGVYWISVYGYRAPVRVPANEVGKYTLRLGFQSTTDDHGTGSCGPPSTNYLATAMAANTFKTGVLTSGDTDRFKISIPAAGTANFYTTGTNDTFGTLTNANCLSPVTDDNTGAGNNFLIADQLVQPGVYYVGVTPGTSATFPAAYTFYCDFFPENVCNSNVSSQISVSATGSQQVSGTIAGGDQIDIKYYGIRLSKAGILKIYTGTFSGGVFVPGPDTYGQLRDINCDIIASSSDEDVHLVRYNFRIEKYLEPGGYYVSLRSEQPLPVGQSFNYTLNIEFVEGTGQATIDDHGNDCDTATAITATETSKAGIINYEGDYDYFKFQFGGGPLRIYSSTDVGSVVDTYGYLLDENCMAIATSDDIDPSGTGPSGTGTPNYNFQIEKKMLDFGTYYIAVREYNRLRTGSYVVNIDDSPSTDDVGDTCTDALLFSAFPFSDTTIYEDAQDGGAAGWAIYAGAGTFTNIYDATLTSRVIQLANNAAPNSCYLRKDNLTEWGNSSEKILQWKMKFSAAFKIYVHCNTSPYGDLQFVYSPDTVNQYANPEVRVGLGTDKADGQWRRFTQNLEADLRLITGNGTATVNSVRYFRVSGNGLVDDIMLRKEHRSETIEATIDPLGDVDFYAIPITDSGELKIWTETGVTNTMDTFGSLKNSSCNQVTFDDDSKGAGYNFEISRLVYEGETYYVAVRDWDEGTTGSYTLQISMGVPVTSIAWVTPSMGQAGTVVTINGVKFGQVKGAGDTVYFGKTTLDRTAATITKWSDTVIECTAPNRGVGYVNNDTVWVVTSGGTDDQAEAFYYAPTPVITDFNPKVCSTGGGALITLTGTFGDISGSVDFGTMSAAVETWTNTAITCRAPAQGAAGNVTIYVKNSYGVTGASGTQFAYQLGPNISNVSPNFSNTCVSKIVTITGTGFGAKTGTARLMFGTTDMTASATWTDTQITFTAPISTAATKDIEIRSSLYTSTPPYDTFVYTAAGAYTYYAPTINSISPAGGSTCGGAVITIGGNYFCGPPSAAGTVTIVGVGPASSSTWTENLIVCAPPAGSAGDKDIIVTNSAGQGTTKTAGFTYADVPPVISLISPAQGSTTGGLAVTIFGEYFGAQTGSANVTFAGQTSTPAISSWTDNMIKLTAPTRAAGACDVVVTNCNGVTGTSSGGFTYKTICAFTPITKVNLNYSFADTLAVGQVKYYEFWTSDIGSIDAWTTGSTDTYAYLYKGDCTNLVGFTDDTSTSDFNFTLSNPSSPADVYYLAVGALAFAVNQTFDDSTPGLVTASSNTGTYGWSGFTSGTSLHHISLEGYYTYSAVVAGYTVSGYAQWPSFTLPAGYKYKIQVERPANTTTVCNPTPIEVYSGGSPVYTTTLNLTGAQAWVDLWDIGLVGTSTTYTVRLWPRQGCRTCISGMRVMRRDPGGGGNYTIYIQNN